MNKKQPESRISQIQVVLDYIHQNISELLSVEQISAQCCWSRWQLQRVFSEVTGFNIAQYVRELRLSFAAEQLLASSAKHLDIALNFGFDSEHSFSRSFKQFFKCSPGVYRSKGQRDGLQLPLDLMCFSDKFNQRATKVVPISIKTRAQSQLMGISGDINGVLSTQPNFAQQVPLIWQQFHAKLNACGTPRPFPLIGVLATWDADHNGTNIPYWASCEHHGEPILNGLTAITLPSQLYAVISYTGPISELHKTIEWFIFDWLPNSGYTGLDGYDLEVYDANFDIRSPKAKMEYWIPISASNNNSLNQLQPTNFSTAI